MNVFNNQINVNNLPRVLDVDFIPLPSSAIYIGVIQLCTTFLLITVLTSLLVIIGVDIFQDYGRYIYLGILGLFVLSIVLHILGFKYKKYALRKRDIIYQDGYIWRKLTTIPFNKIQHCEVSQGPIHRILQVSKLKIYTAGGSSSDLSISGLHTDDAHRIKNFILAKTGFDEEE